MTAATLKCSVEINVLDAELYNDAHIKGSINVDYKDLIRGREKDWDINMPKFVVYCANYRLSCKLRRAKILIKEVVLKRRTYGHMKEERL